MGIKVQGKYKQLRAIAKKYKVLYVEDDSILQETTAELFMGVFKEVVLAKDGEEALELYDESINIVITDIQMPHMNGIELSRAIIQRNKEQKIIVVSAYDETQYFIELIRIGISGFMQKPLTLIHVSEILYEVCLELQKEEELVRYTDLGDTLIWDSELENLLYQNQEIKITLSEKKVLDLLLNNRGTQFTDIDLFNHINFNNAEKDFSSNAIKSLLKRLRKKLPKNIISTEKNLGYSIKL